MKHYNPKPIFIAERFRFHKRDQRPEESVKDFNVSLRKHSEYCNFGAKLNDSLRDRFVCGLKNETIQKRLLSERDLTYVKAVDMAIAIESALKDVRELQGKETPSTVHKIGDRKKKTQKAKPAKAKNHKNETKKPCFRCNRTNHAHQDCKFKDSKCYNCAKVGHMASACPVP